MRKIAILGASSGLGLEIAKLYSEESSLFLSARKTKNIKLKGDHFYFDCDFTKQFAQLLVFLKSFNPEVVIYCAGGGPYGKFKDKELKDHEWSLAVNFLAPQKLIHSCLNDGDIKKLALVGSAVAEDLGDINASSYAAGKHALVGLHKSIILEEPEFDLRLFSPGYMNTKMLPKSAPVRKTKNILEPLDVAMRFKSWFEDGSKFQQHLKLT